MEGVGPGTTLDGRYTTQRRIEQRHGGERWTADDTTLGRSVVVLCLPDEDHRASALLDAARRAAGLEAPTLLRVLDVGRERGLAWVVEAESAGARSLAQLVHEGGLPADEVRRIVGEVATALESARQRGLHHLDLRPEDVLRTLDGEVRVRGVATTAALLELDDLESEDASRRDAIGVVSLAYAGLTGLWPGEGQTSLGPAPRVVNGVAAPSEIAAGVPRDLDALCRLTLGEDQGPTSPGDFARQIAPWPSRQVAGRSTIATTGVVDPRVPTALTPAALAPSARPTSATPAASAAGAAGAAVPDESTAPLEPVESRESDEVPAEDVPTRVIDRSGLADTAPDESTQTIETTPATEAIPVADPAVAAGETPGRSDLDSTAELQPVRPAPPSGDDDTGPGPEAGRGSDDDTPARPDDAAARSPRPTPGTNAAAAARAAAAASAAGAAMAGAGSAVAGAVGRVGSRVGSLGRQVGDRAAEKAAERRGFRERVTGPNAPGLTPDGERLRPGTGRDAFLEAPAPLVPAQPLNRRESKLALGIVAAFLVLALAFGVRGVMQIGSNTDLDFGGVPDRASTPSATRSPTPTGSGTASPSATTGEPLQILGADGFDPQGDGRENGTRAPRVFDGNPSTSWQSEGYSSAEFGGLKQGVGVSVDLGPNVAARSVTLTLTNEADVAVYINSERSLSSAIKVGEKAGVEGPVTFPVKAGTQGQYVIVWFTGLTTDSTGRYRALLGEVEVKN
ncbi:MULTISPECIES: hypothetical protein [unclassified Knoellia]|uniref:hypothetical protein n=1 Tax=Knoellia altitudinis TaxID=3404795 RepID=UPI00360ACECD